MFLIYVAMLSDKRVKHCMQLHLFSQHFTFKCVNVVHSKRHQNENKVSFQEEVADVAAWQCSHRWWKSRSLP